MKRTKPKSAAPDQAANDSKVIQLKITLVGSKPPIWRSVQVRESIHLGELHRVVQIAMGWDDTHLHLFQVGNRSFSLFSDTDDAPPEEEDSRTVSLRELGLVAKGRKFTYIYDFGDDWIHQIEVEAARSADSDVFYPVCVAGKKACPPEDCSGIWGYYQLLEILKNPRHPEHQERREWLGGDLDPDLFDLAAVNQRLRITFEAMEPVVGLGKACSA
jgi:hypothetical protein